MAHVSHLCVLKNTVLVQGQQLAKSSLPPRWLICRLMVELQGRGGGRDWRFVCGLISAFLANSPSAIMARVLSDLSGIFCMFGFYLIMFYSGTLLCKLCSARLCCCCTQNKHFTGWPNVPSILYDFPLIIFLSSLWNYKVAPWSDGANVPLAGKRVQKADIHIYNKNVIFVCFQNILFCMDGGRMS